MNVYRITVETHDRDVDYDCEKHCIEFRALDHIAKHRRITDEIYDRFEDDGEVGVLYSFDGPSIITQSTRGCDRTDRTPADVVSMFVETIIKSLAPETRDEDV